MRNLKHTGRPLFTADVLKRLLSHKSRFVIPQIHVGFILLDGDKKAYSESSQWAIKGNKEVISKLRQENKQLRAKLSKRMKVSIHNVQEYHNLCQTSMLIDV